MKRLGFKGALVFTALSLWASGALAQTFTLNSSALLMLWETYENPNTTGVGSSDWYGTTSTTAGLPWGGGPMAGQVGFVGNMYSPTPGGFAQQMIGANFWGTSGDTGYSGAKTAAVLGAALGTGDTNDLSAFTSYSLTLYNDNDDDWFVNLHLNTGFTDAPWLEPNNYYQNGWTVLAAGGSTTLSVDLSTALNLNHVSNIGVSIASNMGAGAPWPSNPDVYHISASPVPEPSTLLALGSGLLGLAGARWGFRRKSR